MQFKRAFGVATASALGLTVFRAMLKILFIDTLTGFYSRENILGAVFNLGMFAVLAVLAVAFFKERKSVPAVKTGRTQEFFAVFTGVVIALYSVLAFVRALALDPEMLVNQLPKGMQLVVNAGGVVAGGAMIAVALLLLSGARADKRVAVLALVPALWHAFFMVGAFMNYRFPVYASDELFGTLYLAGATLFFYYYAGSVSQVVNQPMRAAVAGAVSALCGVVIAVGQLFAMAVLGAGISGPDTAMCLLMLTLSLYQWVFVRGILNSID